MEWFGHVEKSKSCREGARTAWKASLSGQKPVLPKRPHLLPCKARLCVCPCGVLYYILGKSSKLQFNVPELKIKRGDNTDICSKVLNLTPQDRKRLDINKSTLWYLQKHVREGKRIRVYGKVRNRM